MVITLNHTIVPARDKVAAAKFFARIFGVKYSGRTDYFAPVRVNKTLTLLFDEERSSTATTTPSTSARKNSMRSSSASSRPALPTAAHRGA